MSKISLLGVFLGKDGAMSLYYKNKNGQEQRKLTIRSASVSESEGFVLISSRVLSASLMISSLSCIFEKIYILQTSNTSQDNLLYKG